jgi:hypothetical protein
VAEVCPVGVIQRRTDHAVTLRVFHVRVRASRCQVKLDKVEVRGR